MVAVKTKPKTCSLLTPSSNSIGEKTLDNDWERVLVNPCFLRYGGASLMAAVIDFSSVWLVGVVIRVFNPFFTCFWANFPIFQLIFSYFLREAETYIFPIFFPILGRRPEMGSVPGKQDPKIRVLCPSFVGCLEKGWNRQGVRLQYSDAPTTLETCLEHPFTQPIANKLLHSKQQKSCNSSSTIANYCVAWTIARTIATANNYCSDTPCGIHPFSEHPRYVGEMRSANGTWNLIKSISE